ncbi:MAG: hypothetical protein WCK51_01085 [Armatimonadota bacterium]
MSRSKPLALLALLVTAACSSAAINIRLQSYPYEIVADGRSQVNISIEARNNDGSVVPDGTKILLNTTLGSFREQVVTISGGRGQAILTAGNIPGVAKITATELNNQSNPSTLEVLFVSSKDKLATASDYISINVPSRFEYHLETRTLTGAGSKQNVTGVFRETAFKCDDIQYLLDSGELRAKNATLSVNKKTYTFSEFFMDTRSGRGYGVTVIEYTPKATLTYTHGLFSLSGAGEGEDFGKLKPRQRVAVVDITPLGVKPITVPIPPETFTFKKTRKSNIAATQEELKLEDPNDLQTGYLTATRFSYVMRRELQFQDVKVYQGEDKIWSQGLMSFSAGGFQGQYPMQQYFTITDNQFGVNYPFFLNLGRQSSSAVRFRTGQSYGSGINVNRGVFFDYESNWNRRDNSVGGMTISGVGRDDYQVDLRQTLRLNPNTSANFTIGSPQFNSLLGNVSLSQQQREFQFTLNSTQNRSLRGVKNNQQDYSLIGETNPVRLKGAPISLYPGFSALYSEAERETGKSVLSGFAPRMRITTDQLQVNTRTSLSAGFTLEQFVGSSGNTLNTVGELSYRKSLGNAFSSTWIYNFSRNQSSDQSVGQQQLSNYLWFEKGKLALSLNTTKTLDVDNLFLNGQADYLLADLWKTSFNYRMNKFSTDTFVDYNLILAYRIAKDKPFFGLAYSKETNRIGFVVLNGLR